MTLLKRGHDALKYIDYKHAAETDVKLLRELVAEMSDALAWRTIHSAPKDGTNVLLYDNFSDPGEGGRDFMYIGWFANFNSEWLEVGSDCKLCPTHWMPLPAPPQDGDPIVQIF